MINNQEWEHILKHTLGAGELHDKRNRGYRNRYCTNVGDRTHKTLIEMSENSLMSQGDLINDGKSQMFYATVDGCKYINLTEKETKRALEP